MREDFNKIKNKNKIKKKKKLTLILILDNIIPQINTTTTWYHKLP